MTRYINPHVTQYDGSRYASANCTPASGANGANAATGGKVARTGAQVRAIVARDEEQNPGTPGWTLRDLDLAMTRLGVTFTIRSGTGWAAAVKAHDAGYYIVIQGDSDRFADSTCSGAFDGDHCIGAHPDEDGTGRWRIDDPICRVARYERPEVIRAYAQKFSTTVNWGMFLPIVPLAVPDTDTEDSMKFAPTSTSIGTATVKSGAKLRRVSDGASVSLPSGVTTRNCYSEATWGLNQGYLVTLDDEAHLLRQVDVSKFTPAKPAPKSYAVVTTVGGKRVAGNVTLP